MIKFIVALLIVSGIGDAFAETPIVYTRCKATTDTITINRDVTLNSGAGGGTLNVSKTFIGLSAYDTLPDVTNFFSGFAAPCDLIHRDASGIETVIHDCSTTGSVIGQPSCAAMDASVSFDADKITYAVFRGTLRNKTLRFNNGSLHKDAVPAQGPISDLPNTYLSSDGAHLITYTFSTETYVDLTSYNPGVYDSGPAYMSNGRIAFTSTRGGHTSPVVFRSTQSKIGTAIWSIDANGSNVSLDSHHSRSQEQHPLQLKDGRLAYSSWQIGAGLAFRKANSIYLGFDTLDNYFNIWSQRPDGTLPFPLLGQHRRSGYNAPSFGEDFNALHFIAQMSDGRVATSNYYRGSNNNALGVITIFGLEPPGREGKDPLTSSLTEAFLPHDISNFASWSINADRSSLVMPGFPSTAVNHPNYTGRLPWRGKVGHPFALPNNELGLVWGVGSCSTVASSAAISATGQQYPQYTNGTGGGAVLNMITETSKAMIDLGYDGDIPGCNLGLYKATVIPSVATTDLAVIADTRQWHELMARSLVPYQDIHGVPAPANITTPQSQSLPQGTPYAMLGSASITDRETFPKGGIDKTPIDFSEGMSFHGQGTDLIDYTDDDLCGIRIMSFLPNTSTGVSSQIANITGERLSILGEFPVRNKDQNGDPIIDPSGNEDTSFLVKMPANMAYTMAGIDCDGHTLNIDQTWQSLKPGEQKTCGGCHVHSRATRINFSQSHASTPGYIPYEIGNGTVTLLDGIDGSGDVKTRTVSGYGYIPDFNRDIKPIFQAHCVSCHGGSTPAAGLVLDSYPSNNNTTGSTWWRLIRDNLQTYVPDSLRLKYNNGNTGVIARPWVTRYVKAFNPRGSLLFWKAANKRMDNMLDGDVATDIDFGASHPTGITGDELSTLSRWISIGSPGGGQELLDTLSPTLNLTANKSGDMITGFRIGVTDIGGGVDLTTANLTVNGNNVPVSLVNDGVLNVTLSSAISDPNTVINMTVDDNQGNTTTIERTANFFLQLPDQPATDPNLVVAPVYGADGIPTGTTVNVKLRLNGTVPVTDKRGRDVGQRIEAVVVQ